MPEMKFSERDLLIELKTSFRDFRERITEELKNLRVAVEGNDTKYDELVKIVTTHDQLIKENTDIRKGFRKWVYGGLVTGVLGLIFSGLTWLLNN